MVLILRRTISMQTRWAAEQLSNAKAVDAFIACAGLIQIRQFWTTRLDNSFDWIIRTKTSSLVCHECNSLKSGTVADDFIRELYRRGRLNAAEMESRLSALAALQRGEVKPITLTLQASERT